MVDDNSEHQKAKGVIKMLLQHWAIVNTNMFCWIINVWGIQWIGSKVNTIKYEPTKSAKLSCFDDKIYILNNGYDGLALGY